MPAPPELVAILHWHINEFGLAPDGRLFRQQNGNVVSSSTYSQVWQAARVIALTPDQVAALRWPHVRMTCGMLRCRSG